jgi:hypothetical protein
MEGNGGGHWMPNQLMTAVLAGVLALLGMPAFALDLPDSGSKNFSPGTGTPTHFANETVPVSARTADTTASDFSAEEAAAPMPSVVRPAASAHSSNARHGKYASAQRTGKNPSGKMRGNNHSTRVANASGKSARVAGARGGPTSVTPSTPKTATARHGKAGARHASVAVTYPTKA